MPQRRIVKGVQYGNIDPVQSPRHGDRRLRIAGFRLGLPGCIKLMGQDHVPPFRIDLFSGKQEADRFFITQHASVRKQRPQIPRLQKGQQIKVHRAVFVRQLDFFQKFVLSYGRKHGQIDAVPFQKGGGIGQPLRGIVVARDDEHLDPGTDFRQRLQEAVKHHVGLAGRGRFVVNVPADQDSVRVLRFCIVRNLRKHSLLIFSQAVAAQQLPDM